MTSLRVQYPWKQVKKGQGFFVPCLDTEAVKVDGLQQALRHRLFYAKAKVGTMNGKIGVWFYL
jgi:hypothetical protein